MDFIIGGICQGKTSYAMEKYGLTDSDFSDGKTMELEIKEQKKAISNFHIWIKRIIEAGEEPLQKTKELLAKNPDVIIVMDEVGNGIIPINKEERFWREQVGICGCYIAKEAKCVIRLVCGLPQKLK